MGLFYGEKVGELLPGPWGRRHAPPVLSRRARCRPEKAIWRGGSYLLDTTAWLATLTVLDGASKLFVKYNSWAAVRNQANWPGIHGIGTRVGTLSAGYRARGLGEGGTSSRASSKENPSRLSSGEKTQGGCHAIHSQEASSAGPWHRCAKMIFTTNAYDASSQPIRRKY